MVAQRMRRGAAPAVTQLSCGAELAVACGQRSRKKKKGRPHTTRGGPPPPGEVRTGRPSPNGAASSNGAAPRAPDPRRSRARARLLALLLAPAAGLVAPARPAASVKVQGVSDMIGGTIETAGLWDPLRLSGRRVGRAAPPLAVCGAQTRPRRHGRDGGLPLQRPPAELSGHAVAVGEPEIRRRAHGFGGDARLPPTPMPIAGWVQIIGFIGVIETTTFKQDPAEGGGQRRRRPLPRYSDPAERETKLMLGAQERAPRDDGHHGHAGGGPAHGHGPICSG